jgi:hypothetical protein
VLDDLDDKPYSDEEVKAFERATFRCKKSFTTQT